MHKLLFPAMAAIFFLAGGAGFLSAQAEELSYDHRVTGDRSISMDLGGIFPEAFEEFPPSGTFHSPNLDVGITLGLDLNFYVSEQWTVGAAINFMTASGVNTDYLFLVPLTAQTGWEFTFGHLTFPVGLGAGICFATYGTNTVVNPLLIPSVGAYWNMSSTWSFGVTCKEWVIFQPYLAGGTVPASDSRIAYFGDTTLGFIYHF